jgi:hypothetical protein
MPKKKSSRKKQTNKKTQTKRPRAKASARSRAAAPPRKAARRPARKSARAQSRTKARRTRGSTTHVGSIAPGPRSSHAEAAGQSGDNERLSRVARADSQSVEELEDEGQSFEAEVVSGVEDADDSEAEVTTHEVPEDDVPSEYDGDR